MDQVLVTGANGFVGSHICETLVNSGLRVRALVRKTSDLTNIKNLDLQLAYGDLNVPASLPPVVAGVDAIVNNAGITRAIDPQVFDLVNSKGTENLLRAAEAVPELKRFIQISSTAACGPASSGSPRNEDQRPEPLTAYGRSKLDGEKAVLAFKEKFPVTVLRPSAIYGPRDKDMLSFFKIVKLRLKPTFGTGESYINFTFVRDLALAVTRALLSDSDSGNIYNVAERKAYSYSEAGDIISETLGVRALDIHIPRPVLMLAGRITEKIAHHRKKATTFTEDKALEMSQKYWLFDTSKIEKELDFVSATSFRSGVAETVEWYRKHGWL